MKEQSLQEYFEFDEADLEANRKGQLSEKQLKQAVTKTRPRLGFESLAGSVLFLVAGAGLFAGVKAIYSGSNMIEKIVFGFLFGLVWPYAWGKMGLALINFSRPKKNVRVMAERGRLKFVHHNEPDIVPYYELSVGGRKIEVEDDLSSLVRQREMYAVYYLERTKGLLSIEHIPKEK